MKCGSSPANQRNALRTSSTSITSRTKKQAQPAEQRVHKTFLPLPEQAQAGGFQVILIHGAPPKIAFSRDAPIITWPGGAINRVGRHKKTILYKPPAPVYNDRQGMKFSLGKPKPLFQKLMTSVIDWVAEAVGFFCVPKEELVC